MEQVVLDEHHFYIRRELGIPDTHKNDRVDNLIIEGRKRYRYYSDIVAFVKIRLGAVK